MTKRLYSVVVAIAAAAAFMITGCGGSGGSSASGPVAAGLSGRVDGGSAQNPINGASVQLYAMGTDGYGTASTLGLAVQTDDGAFTLGSYTCPDSDPETYIVATGGDAGGGTNSAIALMALTGPCDALTATTFVTINELTTVAAEWAMAQFSDSTGFNIGTSSTNARGLNNATSMAQSDLVVSYLVSGGSPGNTGIPAEFWANNGADEGGCAGGSPAVNCDGLERLNTLADILAACVNSSGPSFTACSTLFGYAGERTTTLGAAHAIVTNPENNVGDIYELAPSPDEAPFTPMLPSAPNDWTLALTYGGGGLSGPESLAIDSSGDVWVANNSSNSISELNSSGTVLSGDSGFTGGGLDGPTSLAIDNSADEDVWVANSASGSGTSISEFDSSGNALSPSTGLTGGGLDDPISLAIDESDRLWIVNYEGNSVSEFDISTLSFLFPTGFTGGTVSDPKAAAVDASGNVWVVNSGNDENYGISKFDPSSSQFHSFTGGNLALSEGIAVDASGNIWVTNQGTFAGVYNLSEFDSTGSPLETGSYDGGGLNGPQGIAIDSSTNVWVANSANPFSISEFDSLGNPITTSTGYTTAGLASPGGIAIDRSGDVWVTNDGGDSISEFIGAAGPVVTPMAASFAACGEAVCQP